MINKIKKYIYGLFNGLSVADREISTNTNNINETVSIEKHQEASSMADAMLKGEVTEEVKEMRHRNYKVSRESEHFSYLGNGLAVKNDDKLKPHYRGLAFGGVSDVLLVQDNSLVYNNVYEELERVNSYGGQRNYVIKCERDCLTRFRLEEFTQKLIVKKTDNKDKVKLQFYVSQYHKDDNLILTKGFLNEIEAVFNKKKPSDNDIFNIKTVWFITQNAYNSDDLFKYEYINISFETIENYEGCYVIIFNGDVSVNGEDLTKKYYNKTVEERYKNKEKRNSTFILNPSLNEEYKCSICGNVINKYDAQITEVTFGKPMCVDCLVKEEGEKNGIIIK